LTSGFGSTLGTFLTTLKLFFLNLISKYGQLPQTADLIPMHIICLLLPLTADLLGAGAGLMPTALLQTPFTFPGF
jgi:hypothetical protein